MCRDETRARVQQLIDKWRMAASQRCSRCGTMDACADELSELLAALIAAPLAPQEEEKELATRVGGQPVSDGRPTASSNEAVPPSLLWVEYAVQSLWEARIRFGDMLSDIDYDEHTTLAFVLRGMCDWLREVTNGLPDREDRVASLLGKEIGRWVLPNTLNKAGARPSGSAGAVLNTPSAVDAVGQHPNQADRPRASESTFPTTAAPPQEPEQAHADMWRPIETAPTDGTPIWVRCPGREGLPPLVSLCAWHPDAGLCVDELREPTQWMPIAAMPWHPIVSAPQMRKLIVFYRNALGKGRRVMGCYYPAHSLEIADDGDGGEYDDASGRVYAAAGWYEEQESNQPLMPLEGDPTHWMPLPDEPMSPSAREAQAPATVPTEQEELLRALKGLVGVIAADDLVPESVSYMREARSAIRKAERVTLNEREREWIQGAAAAEERAGDPDITVGASASPSSAEAALRAVFGDDRIQVALGGNPHHVARVMAQVNAVLAELSVASASPNKGAK